MNTKVPAYNYKCLKGNGMKKEINDNNKLHKFILPQQINNVYNIATPIQL